MLININLGPDSYDIVIEKGCLNKAGDYLNLDRKVLIVTDDGVPSQYSKTLASMCKDPVVVVIPQGEETKNMEEYKGLLATMLSKGFTRKDCVAAVGGGVCGDLAGFAAATYMRGIDFYNIPTTILSQVDSSIGGKTAINFNGIKNIIGAFYQPGRVLVDTNVLETLSERQKSAGLAEALKMALTFDSDLFYIFENKNIKENLDVIIEKSLRIKAVVVEKDEKEAGLRRALNFGHTIGHGIESLNPGHLYHGECIAIGMIPMCSEDIALRLIKILKKMNLPTEAWGSIDKVCDAMSHDKKSSEGSVTIIKTEKIGTFYEQKSDLAELRSLASQVVKGV